MKTLNHSHQEASDEKVHESTIHSDGSPPGASSHRDTKLKETATKPKANG